MWGGAVAPAWVAWLAVLAAAALAPAAAQAATPGKPVLGINGDKVFLLPQSQWPVMLSGMKAAGVSVVRDNADWENVEPTAPGASGNQYDWSSVDSMVTALAEYGMRWLPVVAYSTTWSASYSTGGGLLKAATPDLYSPPVTKDYGDYADFAAAVVARYGPGGTFWTDNPALTPEPVTQIQIWDEPNSSYFWAPTPNAGAYANLYTQARTAIHAVDPSEEVSIGALGNPAGTFLDQMFDADPSFQLDAAADTPYDDTPGAIVNDVAGLRYALDAHNDVTTPIEVSEFGWPTAGSLSYVSTLTDQARAQAVTQTMQSLATGDCGVDLITPYTWVTTEATAGDAVEFFGFVTPSGAATATSNAFGEEITELDALPTPTHATTATCDRAFTLAPVTKATSPGAGTTCVAATPLAWYHIPVAGATVAATATDTATGAKWTATGTSASDGTATLCLKIPSGTPVTISVTAEHPYFEPVATGSISLTAT